MVPSAAAAKSSSFVVVAVALVFACRQFEHTETHYTHARMTKHNTHTHTDTQWANNNKYIACEWGEKPTMCTQATRNDEETTENTQQKCLFPYVFVCFGAVTPERANSHSICFIRSTTKLDFSSFGGRCAMCALTSA